jgi:protein SCO1
MLRFAPFLLSLTLLITSACAPQQRTDAPTLAAAADSPASFGVVGEFELIDQRGARVTNLDVADRPRLYGFFFTSCTGPCPRLTANMRQAQELLADEEVGLVSISVDPEKDTPEVLAAYAKSFTADTSRWVFLTGAEDQIYPLMRTSFALGVDKLPDSEAVAALRVSHATRLVTVDDEGAIRGYYDGESEEGLEAAVERMRFLASGTAPSAAATPSSLPLVNASLNGVAAVLLLLGYLAIRRDRRELHAKLMGAALLCSAFFLSSYVYYHVVVIPLQDGPTKYNGGGALKVGYLILLVTHVIGAIVNLPMVLLTFWRAHKQRWESHARLARKTWPLWMYVSVTGVLVYLMLYPWNPPLG